MPGLHSHQRFCDLADAEVARFADAIRGADPATPVPTVGTPADHRPRLTVTGDPALLAHRRQHALI
jgi:hypothetical protein